MTASQRDLKDYISLAHGGQLDVTAGGAGDASEEDGEWIDCRDFQSVVLAIAIEATLADTETATVTANAQTASDGSGTGAADFGDAATELELLSDGGTTERGVVELGLNLNHSEFLGWIRAQFTVTMSAGATDTARATVVAIRGGAQEKPAA